MNRVGIIFGEPYLPLVGSLVYTLIQYLHFPHIVFIAYTPLGRRDPSFFTDLIFLDIAKGRGSTGTSQLGGPSRDGPYPKE
jgi:hypothetical protein